MQLKDFLLKALWQDPNYEIHQVNCPEISIEGISPALYAKLLASATAAGAKFDGSEAQWHGCTFAWEYDAPSQTLRATCTRKPFFISCDQIEQGIAAEIAKAKTSL